MRRRSNRLKVSPGLVVSVVAVFFAIGGIGYAASKIGTDDIQDGAVTKKKLDSESVNSKRIVDKTIKYKDLKFSPDSLQGPEGPQGPQGEQGPQGPAGPANVDVDLKAEIETAAADPSLDDGSIVPLAVNEGFAWAVFCQAGASGTPGTGAVLAVQNLDGGDNSHIAGALTFIDADGNPIADQSEDFDVDEVAIVGNAFTDNTMSRAGYPQGTSQGAYGAAFTNTLRGGSVLIYGNNGETQMGEGGVMRTPTGYPGTPACVGSLNLLAK